MPPTRTYNFCLQCRQAQLWLNVLLLCLQMRTAWCSLGYGSGRQTASRAPCPEELTFRKLLCGSSEEASDDLGLWLYGWCGQSTIILVAGALFGLLILKATRLDLSSGCFGARLLSPNHVSLLNRKLQGVAAFRKLDSNIVRLSKYEMGSCFTSLVSTPHSVSFPALRTCLLGKLPNSTQGTLWQS